MTARHAWNIGYFEGHRQVMVKTLSPQDYDYNFRGPTMSAVEWGQIVELYDSIGLLTELTTGYEDGIAAGFFDSGLLHGEPVFCRPGLAPGEDDPYWWSSFPTETCEKVVAARNWYLASVGRLQKEG